MKKLLILLALLCPALAIGQTTSNFQTILISGSGRPINASVSICTTGLATTGASVGGNVATLTFASNPLTLGFVAGATVTVSAFTGADTYLNGTFPILA